MLIRDRIGAQKILLASIFALSLLAILPAMASASDFSLVKSIIFSPNAIVSSFIPFTGTLRPLNIPGSLSLASFTQKKSVASLRLSNSSGTYALTFTDSISGQVGTSPTSIGTIFIKSSTGDNVICDSFSETNVSCVGQNMTMNIVQPGKSWNGAFDNYTFSMASDTGTDGSNLGFSHAQIIGIKDGNVVLNVSLNMSTLSFSYARNPDKAVTSFQLSGGNISWINKPGVISLRTPGLVWNSDNFHDAIALNGGSGSVFGTVGFGGSISFTLQGTYVNDTKTYPIRNEIYMNLNTLQFSDCPIFTRNNIVCYIRSGYIHTYLPLMRDTTFWKSPIRLFVLNITNSTEGATATLTGGQTSASDVFNVTGITVKGFRFTQFS